jgi:amino acid transporter
LIGFHKSFFTGSLAILATAPFFLAGFETIPQAVEDAKGDITSVGKTVVLSVGIACIFYAGLLFCLGGAMPWQEFYAIRTPAAGNLFLYAYENSAFGQVMYIIILVGAICGSVSTWNGFMMASPRLLMGMARGYMMPRIMAKQNKYGTPSYGLIACFALSLVGPFLGLGLIDPLTSFSAAGFVCSWMITASAVVSLRKKEPNAERPYRMPGGSKMAGFAAIVMALIFVLLFVPNNPVYMGTSAIVLFISWMVLGVVLYLAAGASRRSVSVEERTRSLFERN